MSTTGEEKRRKTRVAFEGEAVIRTMDEEITAPADIRDISMQGIFLRTAHQLHTDTLCDVEIMLTGASTRLSLKVKGQVVRSDEDGLGIEFKGVDIDSYFHLKNLVMYNAADPAAIEDESPL